MDYDLNLSIKIYETPIINICLNTQNLLSYVLDIHHLASLPNIHDSLASSPGQGDLGSFGLCRVLVVGS